MRTGIATSLSELTTTTPFLDRIWTALLFLYQKYAWSILNELKIVIESLAKIHFMRN